jgi:hypothetical protein
MKLRSGLAALGSSLFGNIALFELAVALPLVVMAVAIDVRRGQLSADMFIQIVLTAVISTFFCGIAFWYSVSSPLIRRRRKTSGDGTSQE